MTTKESKKEEKKNQVEEDKSSKATDSKNLSGTQTGEKLEASTVKTTDEKSSDSVARKTTADEKSSAEVAQKTTSDEKSSDSVAQKTTSDEKSSAEVAQKVTAGEKSSDSVALKTTSDEKTTVEVKSSDKKDQKKARDEKNTSQQDEKISEDKKSSAPVEKKETVQLNGLFAFKMSMSTFYNEKGESFPVTALKYEPCFVSQIKTKEKDSYSGVQVAFKAQKNKRCSKALIKHLTPAGFKEGARFVKEIRQNLPEGIKSGQEVSIESLKKGDMVKLSALSKGRGFTGVMKRWNFAGGKASHGSKSHRRTGSIGQHTEPARVFPGRKMPGRHGFQKVSLSRVPVVDVLTEEGIIFVKGPVPGARNTLVSIQKN